MAGAAIQYSRLTRSRTGMQSIRVPVLLCSLWLILAGPVRGDSPVWEVRGAEGAFLLGGTIHMLRPQDFPLPPVFDRAYAVTDALVLEVDLGALTSPEIAALVREQGFYPPDRELADDLTGETWARLETAAEDLGIPAEMLARMRPALAGLTLTQAQLARLGVTEMGIDGFYFQRARADGRPLAGLESAIEQMTMLLELGAEDPDRFFAAGFEDMARAAELLAGAVLHWRAGNFDQLYAELIAPTRKEDPTSYQRLFTDRNRAWMSDLEGFAGSPERQLVLVGAGHLGGPSGLLGMLREAGFTVRPWSSNQDSPPAASGAGSPEVQHP